MVRLYLFAEGQTEQTFASTVLKPYLENYQVYMQNPMLIGERFWFVGEVVRSS